MPRFGTVTGGGYLQRVGGARAARRTPARPRENDGIRTLRGCAGVLTRHRGVDSITAAAGCGRHQGVTGDLAAWPTGVEGSRYTDTYRETATRFVRRLARVVLFTPASAAQQTVFE